MSQSKVQSVLDKETSLLSASTLVALTSSASIYKIRSAGEAGAAQPQGGVGHLVFKVYVGLDFYLIYEFLMLRSHLFTALTSVRQTGRL